MDYFRQYWISQVGPVSQQPFGGAHGSGTNDKAGSILNMIRWMSPQTVKENFCPSENYRYPYMDEE